MSKKKAGAANWIKGKKIWVLFAHKIFLMTKTVQNFGLNDGQLPPLPVLVPLQCMMKAPYLSTGMHQLNNSFLRSVCISSLLLVHVLVFVILLLWLSTVLNLTEHIAGIKRCIAIMNYRYATCIVLFLSLTFTEKPLNHCTSLCVVQLTERGWLCDMICSKTWKFQAFTGFFTWNILL